jgi:hypothetical protein
MTGEPFNARAVANMEVALDRVCRRLPDGENHKVRKRVAAAILRCAKQGQTTLAALTAAGEVASPKKQKPKKKSA